MDLLPGEQRIYYSEDQSLHRRNAVANPKEILNSMTPLSYPEHRLVLKNGTPIRLLKSMNPKKGHVYGAR